MIGRYAVLRRLRAEFQKSDVRPWMRGSSGKDSGPASARCRSLSTDWHAVLRFPGCKAAIAGKTEGADPGTKPVGPVGSGTWSGLGSREQQRIWRSGPSADGQWDDRDWDRGTRIRAAANAGGNGRREGAWWPTARSRDFGSRGEKEGEKDGNRSRRRRQRPVSDSRRESQAVRSASEVGKGTGCRWCWESDREVGKGERREGRAVGKWREVMRHRSSSAGRIDPPIPRHRDPVMPLGDGGRRWIFAKCWSSHGYGYGYGCRYGGGGRWRGLTSGGAALGRSEGGLGGASGGVGDVAAAERRSWIMPKTGEPHKGVAETNAEEEEVGEEAEGEKGEGEDWLGEEEVYGKMNTFEAVLDTKRVENDCQSAQHMRTAQERVGLFGYALLTEPKGFRTMTSEAIERSEELIARLKMTPPSIEIVKLLDEISNTVCTALDAAELCCNTHADREYVEEAKLAVVTLSKFIQKLNTSPELYHILARALDAGVIDSEEANLVGRMLRVDFERGGIHLPDEKRAKVEQLTNTITALGMEFQKNIVEEKQEVDVFPASRLRAVPAPVSAMLRPIVRLSDGTVMLASARERTSGLGKKGSDFGARMSPAECGLRVSTDQVILSAILKWVPDAQVRRDIFIAGHSTPKKNLAVLENLIATRHELAELLGFPSFAHYMVQPLVARSPDAILKFLHELSDKLRPKAEEELKLLMECKQSTKPESDIHAWDRAFYNGLVKARTYNLDARTVAAYFSLQGCLSGLSLLTKSLFGVELREIQMPPGEAWAPDIMKLALSHDTEGDLGYIYLDLYPRPNKYPHAAHFTLRCGRRISESEYQLPVVALVCNFPRPLAASPSLLGHGELETLFHEFGHALHSLLSRTEFQHLSGTRAALDFVETPSNLMEYFAWDYRLLSRFARHYSTNDVIPEVMVNAIRQSKLMSSATDMQTQVMYALLDQALFGEKEVGEAMRDTTEILAELQNRHTLTPHVPGTHWQTRFSHLVGYGAGYYSYLYAKCFASMIWDRHFLENPMSRTAGERLRRELLSFGGAKEPLSILRKLAGEDAVIDCPQTGVRPNAEQLLRENHVV